MSKTSCFALLSLMLFSVAQSRAINQCLIGESEANTAVDLHASSGPNKNHRQLSGEAEPDLDACQQSCCDRAESDGCNVAVFREDGTCLLYHCSPIEQCVTSSQDGSTLTYITATGLSSSSPSSPQSQSTTSAVSTTTLASNAETETSAETLSTDDGTEDVPIDSTDTTSSLSTETTTVTENPESNTNTNQPEPVTSDDASAVTGTTTSASSTSSTQTSSTEASTSTHVPDQQTKEQENTDNQTTQSLLSNLITTPMNSTHGQEQNSSTKPSGDEVTSPESTTSSSTESTSSASASTSKLTTLSANPLSTSNSTLTTSAATTSTDTPSTDTTESSSTLSTPLSVVSSWLSTSTSSSSSSSTLSSFRAGDSKTERVIVIPTAHQMITEKDIQNPSFTGKDEDQQQQKEISTTTDSTPSSSSTWSLLSMTTWISSVSTSPPEPGLFITGNDSKLISPGAQEDLALSGALITALCFGVIIFFAVLVLLGKRCFDGWQRRHYSRMDYLINGMYN